MEMDAVLLELLRTDINERTITINLASDQRVLKRRIKLMMFK